MIARAEVLSTMNPIITARPTVPATATDGPASAVIIRPIAAVGTR